MTPLSSTVIDQRRISRGLSLIELLVAMAIGLVVTLAITAVLINSERVKLTSAKLNSASQTGAFASLVLDREIRNAGSGFTQSRSALGCLLNASRGAPIPAQLFPPPALPAPFDTIAAGTPIRLAPAVIVNGAGVGGSDHIVVMSGSHGYGETPRGISAGTTTGTSTVVDSSVGMVNGDLILFSVAESIPPANGAPCMIQQHGAPVNQSLPMAGPYFVAAGANQTLAGYATIPGVTVSSLGWINPVAGGPGNNPPSFRIYGVGNNNTLFSYDLLNTAGAAPPDVEAIAEGVFAMHALYGIGAARVSVNEDPPPPPIPRVPLAWVAPTGATYGIGTLWPAAGTAPAIVQTTVQGTLATIQAIRVAMVLQSNLQERDPEPGEARATPATQLVLFPDVPAATVTIPLTPAQQNFRYRIVETIIPIRNM